MKDAFDEWNEQKKSLEKSENSTIHFPQEGEVWVCILGKNIGREQNGSGKDFSRPVLVVRRFNNNIFWVVPLSTKQKSYDFYYNFVDPNQSRVSAILVQLRMVSVLRFKRFMYKLPSGIYKDLFDVLFSI